MVFSNALSTSQAFGDTLGIRYWSLDSSFAPSIRVQQKSSTQLVNPVILLSTSVSQSNQLSDIM